MPSCCPCAARVLRLNQIHNNNDLFILAYISKQTDHARESIWVCIYYIVSIQSKDHNYLFICWYNTLFLSITCSPWLAQTTKQELKLLGYPGAKILSPSLLLLEVVDEKTIAYLNLRLRTAHKISLMLSTQIKVESFDELFEAVSAVHRQQYIAQGQDVVVYAYSKNSTLHHTPSMQSISQKAVFSKLSPDRKWIVYPKAWTLELEVVIVDNMLNLSINSSWPSLYRRWYRTEAWEAPLKETIAAGLILGAGWKFSDILFDPFCGSGTIAIEAALIAKNIAPWLHRSFAFEQWSWYDNRHLKLAKEQALSQKIDKTHRIFASDIDAEMIEIAQRNAWRAWVETAIFRSPKDMLSYLNMSDILDTFAAQEIESWSWFSQFNYGANDDWSQDLWEDVVERICIVTNPPYGERLKPEWLKNMYRQLVALLSQEDCYGWFISPYDVQKHFDIHTLRSIELRNGWEKVKFWKTS